MIEKDLSLVCSSTGNATLNNFTMGPNWIYDTLLVKESLSVIKVVTYVNRNTTGRTGRDGKRVETVQASYEWIARNMEMSVRAVGTAMRQAIAQGYIIQVKPGRLAEKDKPGEGGWYALNWQWPAVSQQSYVNLNEATLKQAESTLIVEKVDVRQNLQGEARQVLPEVGPEAKQNLPPCRNIAHDSNKPIEIKARLRGNRNKASSTDKTTLTEQTGEGEDATRRKGSTAIGRLISDFTREFGDGDSLTLPNIGRALNLWHKSGLEEKTFIGLIYQARQKTRLKGAIQHHRIAANGSVTDLPNRMPYFFAILSDLISSPQDEFKVHPQGNPQGRSPKFTHRATLQAEVQNTVSLSDSSESVRLVEPETEALEEVAAKIEAEDTSIWQKVLPGLDWLSESKREALGQAVLLPVEQDSRTRARFELKFARLWHKSLFGQWELDRLALALSAELGESLNGDLLLLSS